MSSSQIWDTVVVGAGIEGSSTAYHLAKNGQKTMLLEQFPLPHTRGSSHGQSRIIRKAYGTMEHYTNMMKEAYPLWEQLEKESGTTLYIQTGLLMIGEENSSRIEGSVRAMRKHNLPFEKLDNKRVREKYPNLSYPDNYNFVLDYSGGILRADKALKAFQDQFKRFGGVLHDGEPMVDLFPGDIITVRTTKGHYRTRNVVLTVGPWATKILPRLGVNLPLKPIRITVYYWKEKNPGEYGAEKFPVFSDGKDHFYGLPSVEYPGLFKLCLHYGPEIDPDNRDSVNDDWVLKKATKYVSDYYPGLIPTPAVIETCMYTWLDDENFVLDTHPSWNNVVIGAGFSGHGFKLAPVVGKVLSELAMRKTPSCDMTPFRMDRCISKSKL